MKKTDVTINMTSEQYEYDTNEKIEDFSFWAKGTCQTSEDSIKYLFKESDDLGLGGLKSLLTIKKSKIILNRGLQEADGEPLRKMVFNINSRFFDKYETPYGMMDLEILTKKIDNQLDKTTGKGTLNIDYEICLGDEIETKNKIKIEVT